MELDKIKSIVSEVLDIDENEVKEDTAFIEDLGADSLDLFQIITALETEFDVEFDIDKAKDIITVSDAVDEIKRLRNN